MDLNLSKNLKKDIEFNSVVKNFIEDLSDFLTTSKAHNNCNNINNEKEIKIDSNVEYSNNEPSLEEDKKLQENRKEGHLYLVTEDRNNEIYLWDFTDKPKHEFKEIISSKSLLNVAKEGAMLQYKDGKYELYSPYGYDMLANEKNNEKIEK